MSMLSEQPETADVVIIGGGMMGLCTAYFLAQRQAGRIIIVEQAPQIGGVMTLRCGGGFRQQFASVTNIRLSQLSLRLLHHLADEIGTSIPFQATGYLFVVTSPSTAAHSKEALLLQRACGVHTEWLTAREISRLLPVVRLDGVEGATFHAGDGRINPQLVVQLYQQQIQQANVEVLTETPVLSILRKGPRILGVVTSRGTITTPCVVNAAGAWASKVCDLVNYHLPLTLVRHQVLSLPSYAAFSPGMPTVLFPDEDFGVYAQNSSTMIGITERTVVVESDQESYSTATERDLLEKVRCRLPEVNAAQIHRRLVGLYELTADDHPLLGSIPELEGFYCITGFNGHGFMHAPACGLLLSEEILDGHAHSLESSPLRVSRFQSHQGG